MSQTDSHTTNLALFIGCRRQSFYQFPVRWNQRGEKDPETQKPPKDVWRLGTADERHRGETHKERRRGEVSLSNVLLLTNTFCHPLLLVSNSVCCLLFHRISVTFNVNNSVPPNFEEEGEQGQQKSGEEEVCYTTQATFVALVYRKDGLLRICEKLILILILMLLLAARNCVFAKLCCRSNKTGIKTFPGVWLSFPWRRGSKDENKQHIFPLQDKFYSWLCFFLPDESWWRRGRERHLCHPRGQFPAWGRYGVEGDQLHSKHRLTGLGKIFQQMLVKRALGNAESGCSQTHSLLYFQALYDHLMDFLADRGVDNTFADELIELSTAVEHQEYIKFLEDLESFVKCN